jgi:hypothetical protein
MDHLWKQIERMKTADTPAATNQPGYYASLLSMSIDDMPKMSGKTIGLLMEALFAAYQLGQNRTLILQAQEQTAREAKKAASS